MTCRSTHQTLRQNHVLSKIAFVDIKSWRQNAQKSIIVNSWQSVEKKHQSLKRFTGALLPFTIHPKARHWIMKGKARRDWQPAQTIHIHRQINNTNKKKFCHKDKKLPKQPMNKQN